MAGSDGSNPKTTPRPPTSRKMQEESSTGVTSWLRSWWQGELDSAADNTANNLGQAIPQPAHQDGESEAEDDEPEPEPVSAPPKFASSAVMRAVTAHRMRTRGFVIKQPEARLYFTTLERTESDKSFGLALNQHMRIIALEDGCPSMRAGLCVLDRVVEVDDEVSAIDTIASQVTDKMTVKITIERPVPERLLQVADEVSIHLGF